MSASEGRRRFRKGIAAGAIALLALAAVVLIAQPWQSPEAPELRLAVDTADRSIPHKRRALRVSVSGPGDERASVTAISAEGMELTVERRIRGAGGSTVSLPLTALGRQVFGTCGVGARVRLRIRESGATRLVPVHLRRDPIRCAPLNWAPPPLEDAEEILVEDDTSIVRLDHDRDYRLILPDHKRVGGLQVYGGRHVVLIGGHITVPPSAASDPERKALAFGDQTGTIHVEGVRIDASGGGQGDGISVRAPEAVLQVQNTRIVGLRGTTDGTHADIIQPWGGVRELRVDRLSGSSHFQGLQIPQDRGAILRADLRSIDLRALPEIDGGGHMLWLTGRGCSRYSVRLERVYVAPRPERGLATTVWPEADEPKGCSAEVGDGVATWPALPVEGEVTEGSPPGGSFVPPLVAGIGYRSPGYAREGA